MNLSHTLLEAIKVVESLEKDRSILESCLFDDTTEPHGDARETILAAHRLAGAIELGHELLPLLRSAHEYAIFGDSRDSNLN